MRDIKINNMTDLQENDFDIIYRTPKQVSENDDFGVRELGGTGALPENYIVAKNPEKYLNDMWKDHPARKTFDMNKLPGDYNKSKNIPNEKITNPNNLPTRGVYHAGLDQIAVQPPKSFKWVDQQEFYRDVMHEDTHQRQRRMEFNNPVSRVKSEPSVALFDKFFYNKQIPKDFRERLKQETIPFENRDQMLKDREEVSQDIEKESLTEQLGYYGDYFLRNAYKDPENETERALNRLKFKEAPIWG